MPTIIHRPLLAAVPLLAVALLAGCRGSAPAAEALDGRSVRSLQPGPAAPPTTPAPDATATATGVDALAWMSGTWRGSGLGGVCDEWILPPSRGAMAGMFRFTPSERGPGFQEFFAFEPGPAEPLRVQLLIHHFNPGLTRWEDVPEAFDLIESAPGRAVFRQRGDDGEQSHLVYTRDGDALTAELTELDDRPGAVPGARRVAARFAFRAVDARAD